jgi:hypothetical protein
MPEVDPVTGYPIDPEEKAEKKNAIEYGKFNAQKAKSDQLSASLASETGQTVLHKIQEHLLMRVNELMEADPQCKALKRLLVDMGITINIGEKAVEGLMRLVIKKQTP